MSAAFDPQGDLAQAADGLEAVTLYRRGVTAGAAGQPVAHALRRGPGIRAAAASAGQATLGETVWHLPAEELSQAPAIGDVILDGQGRRWTVLEVQSAALGSRWCCRTRWLALAFALDETLSVLKADYAKGQGGAAVAVWRVWRTGLRARIQPLEAQPAMEHGARRAATRCRILLEENLLLDERHRVQSRDGKLYRVRRTIAPQEIGEPVVVEAELVP